MLVGPSASTNRRPFVCATQALCRTERRAPSEATCDVARAQNSPCGMSHAPRTSSASTGV